METASCQGLPYVAVSFNIGMTGQFPGESSDAYHTLAGMILFNLDRLPTAI